jgi:carboxymethylenebutenolidase
VSSILGQVPSIVANVVYIDEADLGDITTTSSPTLRHIVGPTAPPAPKSPTLVEHRYPAVQSYHFVAPSHAHFHYNTDSVAHTRTLQFLKPRMGGPYFDLETIWDEHCYYEFADRSVEHTMSTMVQEPYVNHVPTMTGGIGRARLTDFYRHNFIFNNSADTALELTSRTVGIDRVIDEFIFKFTHHRELDWLWVPCPWM